MKRVLVVEDNDDNMELLTFILKKNGFSPYRAENGEKGIALALTLKPDFILLDIQLPDIDGIEVIRKIRCSTKIRDIPVIAVTSYAMAGDRDRLMEAGCDGYIEKPIDPETIISEINHTLGI